MYYKHYYKCDLDINKLQFDYYGLETNNDPHLQTPFHDSSIINDTSPSFPKSIDISETTTATSSLSAKEQDEDSTNISKEKIVITSSLYEDIMNCYRYDNYYSYINELYKSTNGIEFEIILYNCLTEHQMCYETEKELKLQGKPKTPDVLFLIPMGVYCTTLPNPNLKAKPSSLTSLLSANDSPYITNSNTNISTHTNTHINTSGKQNNPNKNYQVDRRHNSNTRNNPNNKPREMPPPMTMFYGTWSDTEIVSETSSMGKVDDVDNDDATSDVYEYSDWEIVNWIDSKGDRHLTYIFVLVSYDLCMSWYMFIVLIVAMFGSHEMFEEQLDQLRGYVNRYARLA